MSLCKASCVLLQLVVYFDVWLWCILAALFASGAEIHTVLDTFHLVYFCQRTGSKGITKPDKSA